MHSAVVRWPCPLCGGGRPFHCRPPLPTVPQATLLVVDDEPLNVSLLSQLLRPEFRVRGALSAPSALKLIEAQRPDLVLMDVQMPRLDGLRAAEAIRRLPGWDAVPIIAMTASAFPEDRADRLAAGMDDMLVKPVCPDALAQTLLRWSRPAAGRPGRRRLHRPGRRRAGLRLRRRPGPGGRAAGRRGTLSAAAPPPRQKPSTSPASQSASTRSNRVAPGVKAAGSCARRTHTRVSWGPVSTSC